MYKVYIDGELAYYPGDEMLVLNNAELHLSLNDSGTFEFDIAPDSAFYERIASRVTMVQVVKEDKELFYGEVREISRDLYNIKHVYCVGELAFLFDSVQPQKDYHDLSPRQMLETWLNWHNNMTEEKKHFQTGIVTIHDKNDSIYRLTNEENTLGAIREKLCDRLGGYLKVRKVDGVRYLDWLTLEDYGKICEQPIKFGLNLLDYSENTTADDLYTAVIPHGARQEESPIEGLEAYLDITSVNDGKNYLYIPEAVEQYGWIMAVVHWDDVGVPANLKAKGEQWLRDNQYETMTLELNAVDLSVLSQKFDTFELGDRIHALAAPYGMDRYFPVQKLDIYLQEPDQNILILGSTIQKSYTDQNKDTDKKIEEKLEESINGVRETTAWMKSAIDNATQMMTGSKGGYKISEYDENGRWLRDLYMDAPTKEAAQHVMQINMSGIGFSRTGYDGPYLNAWTIDGVLLGEFLKAGSVEMEALSVEYRSSVERQITNAETGAKEYASAEIKATFEVVDGHVTQMVSEERKYTNKVKEDLTGRIDDTDKSVANETNRAQLAEQNLSAAIELTAQSIDIKVSEERKYVDGVEEKLSASINLQATEIALKVTEGDVESIIDQNADSIRLKASKIAWEATYSRMTENGELTCTSGTFSGKVKSVASKSVTEIYDGELKTTYSDDVYTSYKAYGDSNGNGCAFLVSGPENSTWQRFFVNGSQMMIIGWAKTGIFASNPTVYLPMGICVPANAYINQLFFSNSANTSAHMSGSNTSIVSYTSFSVQGWLTATGTKSRVIDTENHGERLQYCYETPTPMFGDIGTAATDENGLCYVSIDDIFAETVNVEVEYCVFLQKEGPGDIWVDKKETSYFIVKGTPNLAFSWEIKAIQKNYEHLRLDDPQLILHDEEELESSDIEDIFSEEINLYDKEMEELYCG